MWRWRIRVVSSRINPYSSSLDNVETAIVASFETIDKLTVPKNLVMEIQDIRATKRTVVVDRAKELLLV